MREYESGVTNMETLNNIITSCVLQPQANDCDRRVLEVYTINEYNNCMYV